MVFMFVLLQSWSCPFFPRLPRPGPYVFRDVIFIPSALRSMSTQWARSGLKKKCLWAVGNYSHFAEISMELNVDGTVMEFDGRLMEF